MGWIRGMHGHARCGTAQDVRLEELTFGGLYLQTTVSWTRSSEN
jgi:hypothetical protein